MSDGKARFSMFLTNCLLIPWQLLQLFHMSVQVYWNSSSSSKKRNKRWRLRFSRKLPLSCYTLVFSLAAITHIIPWQWASQYTQHQGATYAREGRVTRRKEHQRMRVSTDVGEKIVKNKQIFPVLQEIRDTCYPSTPYLLDASEELWIHCGICRKHWRESRCGGWSI